MQQKQSSTKSKKPRGARAATPISLSDTEKGEPEVVVTKSTKPRKPRTKPTAAKGGPKPKRRMKEDPDGDFSGSGSGTSKSTKKVPSPIAEATASTPSLLTPTSSPPQAGDSADGEDMTDPNQGRRKRRKKTPILAPMNSDEGEDNADFLPPPSAQAELPTSDIEDAGGTRDPKVQPLAIRQCPDPKPAVKVPAQKAEEPPLAPSRQDAFKVLMTKPKKEVIVFDDEPELPPNLAEEIIEAPSRKKAPVTWDSDTGILTIRSSPIILPQSPPTVPSALDILGKKKKVKRKRKKGIEAEKEEIPELSLPEPSLPKASKKTSSKKTKKTTAKFDSDTGILTIRSSPILGPQTPELLPKTELLPKSAFSILGKKKESHPPPAQAQEPPLSPQAPLPIVTIRQAPKKVSASQPQKTVHPFFQPGGLKKVLNAAPPPTETQSDAEDVPFISSRPTTQPKASFFGPNLNTRNSGSWFGGGGGGLGPTLSPTSSRILKSPGLTDAPWPSKDNCHTRGLLSPPITTEVGEEPLRSERKLKGRAVIVLPDEDLLLKYSRELPIQQQREEILAPDYDERRYYNVPSDVRLPKRIVTTGSELQEMVRGRISARLPHPNASRARAMSDSGDESARPTQKKVHPALLKLYKRMKDELTPFDKSECELSSWEVKYAPGSSQEVLQVGKEMQILKDWLMALKVESVGISSDTKSGKRKSRSSTPSGAGVKGAVKKKRKKKKDDELAGFVVDSDEERDEMDEITDPEDNNWSAPSGGKKSIIRAGDKGTESPFRELGRLVNAVVISGPNGCGKTAAVYAVAKEVGFTVFEVSPGTRRSGKDILDQVGEMSRTHLVHQAKATTSETTPFFKPKSVQKIQAEENIAPKIAPAQQQSLILLEEVDLLFEEDKQFWSTVLTLMAQSKRPIILTCNDENLLPLDTLPLHAVLRFTPPPRELVVDQLLLMCANEGHLLQRDAVEGLVESRNGDLRASLVELEFWCRMAVGDRKGGMDWMITRWPIGIDVAENGETLKVVSKDTYIKGMGWMDRSQTDEEATWRNIWETWEVDVGGEGGGVEKLEKCAEVAGKERIKRIAALRVCDEYAEAMSAVDVYAGESMRNYDEVKPSYSFKGFAIANHL